MDIQPPVTAAYGTWKSPITADLMAADTTRFGQVALDCDDIYWSEMRAQEGERDVIVLKSRQFGRISVRFTDGLDSGTTLAPAYDWR